MRVLTVRLFLFYRYGSFLVFCPERILIFKIDLKLNYLPRTNYIMMSHYDYKNFKKTLELKNEAYENLVIKFKNILTKIYLENGYFLINYFQTWFL